MQNNIQQFTDLFLKNLEEGLDNYQRPELNINSDGK